MLDGDLYDQAINSASNGDTLATTLEVQVSSLFVTANRIEGMVECLRA